VQWLYLLQDEGLGVTDRVHPADVGHPAGSSWHDALQRSHRREALGDWRVHLRLGELSFLRGDNAEAGRRWEWSVALRPTAWAVRNLALLDLAEGRITAAAARYLRASRLNPYDLELGVESIGCLIRAGRVEDCATVLDRLDPHHHGSAVFWLLHAEVALAARKTDREVLAAALLERAGSCVGADAHEPWRCTIRAASATGGRRPSA
jgi:hypothetical protein